MRGAGYAIPGILLLYRREAKSNAAFALYVAMPLFITLTGSIVYAHVASIVRPDQIISSPIDPELLASICRCHVENSVWSGAVVVSATDVHFLACCTG